jgi:hypothetical protein
MRYVRSHPVSFLIFTLAVSDSPIPKSQSSTPNQNRDLHLRATIQLISQSYCHGFDKLVGLANFALQIQIQNQGDGPVILCKKYIAIVDPLLSYVRADGTPGDEASHMTDDGFGIFDTHYPKNLRRDYAVIPPRKSFDGEGGASLFFLQDLGWSAQSRFRARATMAREGRPI